VDSPDRKKVTRKPTANSLLSGEESKLPLSRIEMNEDDNIYFENGPEND